MTDVAQSQQSLSVQPRTGDGPKSLSDYHNIVLLADGFSNPFLAKTAISLLRYRTDDIVAVLDAEHVGRTAEDVFGTGGEIPFIRSVSEVDTDAVFVGIAPPGGKLTEAWRPIIVDILQRGIDVVSGLHDFLSADREFSALAQTHHCRLIDVRQNDERETAEHRDFRKGCLRIHTVGHDCSVGKMVTALEIQRALVGQGIDAQFVATGQTGIMISGSGVPIDCVVADFINGAAERLIIDHQQHDVLLIEGQGSLAHPSFSAVTLGLLHGCAPDGLILCYEVGRDCVKSLEHVPVQPLKKLVELYESIASALHPCRVIGVAMNSRRVGEEEAAIERQRVQDELQLPVCDVYRDGATVLVDAVLTLKKELGK